MATAVTKSAAEYVRIKQLRTPRMMHGRYAMNTILSHRRPVITYPVWLPIADPSNQVRTEVNEGGE